MNTRNEIIWGAFLAAAFLGTLIWFARPASPAKPGAPAVHETELRAADPSYHFGTISMARGIVKKTFTIKNAGAEPAEIRQLATSCMCTTAMLKMPGGNAFGPFGMAGHGFPTGGVRQTLPAGSEAEIEIAFDPNAHGPAGIGKIERAVLVEGNFAPLELKFDATVTP